MVVTALCAVGLVTGCGSGSALEARCLPDQPSTAPGAHTSGLGPSTHPEVSTGYRPGLSAVRTGAFAVVTANPHATSAACAILAEGGTAADALVAAQAVLGLVEPQASGLGGGGFLLYYDAATHKVQAYDGRETAPAAAGENYLRWTSQNDHTAPRPGPQTSGRSIGVPGIPRLLQAVHDQHCSKPWRDLFHSAVALADTGFAISDRLGQQIASSAPDLARDPVARSYFLQPDGSPKPTGTVLTNPALAKTLTTLATDGPDAFYHGPMADDIVAAATTTTGARTPSLLTSADLAHYQVKSRDPMCTEYRTHRVCGMPEPSSGGTTVAQVLGILAHFDLAKLGPTDIQHNGGKPTATAVHLISEAERLAYADRDRYLADPDFVPPPAGNLYTTLLNPAYLEKRATTIDPRRSMGTAQPGTFPFDATGITPAGPEHGTSQISIVDSHGNAASMTTTVESAFGSMHMVDGFLLNNQLTDFDALPRDPLGRPVANRVAPGKRPRSSMSPTLVFDSDTSGRPGRLTDVVGSPGGAAIIQFVVKALVEMLDWGLDPQQAASAVTFGATNSPVTAIGGEHPAIDSRADGSQDSLVTQLRAMGHQVSVDPQISGLNLLHRTGPNSWLGGTDPRREGTVQGSPG